MGGIPCDIIINCGIVKGAAAALIANGDSHGVRLAVAGAQLRDQNDEICRFGETAAILEIEFTKEQSRSIYEGGADAIELTEAIEAFVYAEPQKPEEARAVLERVRAFIEAQGEAFRKLVRELKYPHTQDSDSA